MSPSELHSFKSIPENVKPAWERMRDQLAVNGLDGAIVPQKTRVILDTRNANQMRDGGSALKALDLSRHAREDTDYNCRLE